jgi:hypothetical protein
MGHHKMREKSKKQLPLIHLSSDHTQARELARISRILDAEPTIAGLVHQDLCRGQQLRDTGANGMSAEQVLRAAIVKQMFGYSYELLPFHLMDSISLRAFCRIGIADKGFKKSALAKNIKRISPATWEQINRILVNHGKQQKLEKGRQARFDCTVVESNIHPPTDSTLLGPSGACWPCSMPRKRLNARRPTGICSSGPAKPWAMPPRRSRWQKTTPASRALPGGPSWSAMSVSAAK